MAAAYRLPIGTSWFVEVSNVAYRPDLTEQSAGFANAIPQLKLVPKHDYLIGPLFSKCIQGHA